MVRAGLNFIASSFPCFVRALSSIFFSIARAIGLASSRYVISSFSYSAVTKSDKLLIAACCCSAVNSCATSFSSSINVASTSSRLSGPFHDLDRLYYSRHKHRTYCYIIR